MLHYIFWWGMNMMFKMQLIFFGLLILALEFQLPDLIIILLFQVTSFNESFFLLKYKSTVSHSPIEWAYYASGIGKPDVCCYCAAEGIQQDNDLKKKYWVVLPLCQACLRDKKPILYLNEILSKTDKTWTWCCIIVSSHICWINFEPDKVSFLENNTKCFTNFIQKKKEKKKEFTYLPNHT